MEIIEWVFTILSFIAYYFFISKKANKPNFRIIGLILSMVISILISIFSFSIGVISIGILNICSLILTGYGIYTCSLQILRAKNRKDV